MDKWIEYMLPMGSEGLIPHLSCFSDIFGMENLVGTKVSHKVRSEYSQNYLSKVPTLLIKHHM